MRIRAILVGVAIADVALGACTGASTRSAFHPTYKPTPCPQDVSSVVLTPLTCGFLTVLEDRSKPDGRTIRLFAVRIEPQGGHPGPDPMFVADGDVGIASGYASIAGLAQRVNREEVIMDQRGTGHSEPNLGCPEVRSIAEEMIGARLSDQGVRDDLRHAVSACHDRLAATGIDVASYNVAESAADVEDLRIAMGISRWNLQGYGTNSRVLLEVVRRFPEHLRAAVLDTPQFPQVSDQVEAIQGTKDALGQIFADCAASSSCNRRFPDLSTAMQEAVAKLDRTPIETMVTNSGAATIADHPIRVIVDGGAFLRVIRAMVSYNDLRLTSKVPAAVYGALDGKVGIVAKVLSQDSGLCVGYEPGCGGDHILSEGAFYSILCHDEAEFAPSSQLMQLAAGDPGFVEAYVNGPYGDICAAWKSGRAAATADRPVSSTIPILVFAGEYDAYGPPHVAESAVSTLTGAFVVTAPHVGHNVLGTAGCYIDIRNAWIENPASPPDTGCIGAIPPLDFQTG